MSIGRVRDDIRGEHSEPDTCARHFRRGGTTGLCRASPVGSQATVGEIDEEGGGLRWTLVMTGLHIRFCDRAG